MHLPPATQWRLGRSRAHGLTLALALALNAALLFFLWGQVAPSAWGGLLLLALVLLLQASWRWWTSFDGVLRWTGKEWQLLPAHLTTLVHLAPSAQVCTVRWVLDLQTVALVHVGPEFGEGQSRWLWLERGEQELPPWVALRRALVGSALNAQQDGEGRRVGAEGGAIISAVGYLTGSQVPHLRSRGAPAAMSTGANGFRDSTLRK